MPIRSDVLSSMSFLLNMNFSHSHGHFYPGPSFLSGMNFLSSRGFLPRREFLLSGGFLTRKISALTGISHSGMDLFYSSREATVSNTYHLNFSLFFLFLSLHYILISLLRTSLSSSMIWPLTSSQCAPFHR